MMKGNVLLLNLPGFEHAVSSVSINLGIASIAAVLREGRVEVNILDLNLYEDYSEKLVQEIYKNKPCYIGFGVCTPQLYIAKSITETIRAIDNNICIICGGAHPSALPLETLNEIDVDIVCVGEADYTFLEIINNYENLKNVDGIYCKNYFMTKSRGNIIDVEDLPFPALDLFEINKYIYPNQSCKNNPVTLIETSRGCPGNCIFCSRIITGKKCRFKSAERVVDEFIYAKKLGFQEIHLADDNFITNTDRAIKICELLIEKKLEIPWVPRSGVRVDYVNNILLEKMRKAKCYHIPYGIESTSQDVLNKCNKGITISQIENAIKMAKDFGFETTGYFMIGLPGQTVEDIKKDIEFATKTKLDFVKFGVTIPYPGTKLYSILKDNNRIISNEWNKYHFAEQPFEIFIHENISVKDFMKISIGDHKLHEVLNCALDKNLQPVV